MRIARLTPLSFSLFTKASHFAISISSGDFLCSSDEKKKQPLHLRLQRLVTSYIELRILSRDILLYRSCHSGSSKVLTVFILLPLYCAPFTSQNREGPSCILQD